MRNALPVVAVVLMVSGCSGGGTTRAPATPTPTTSTPPAVQGPSTTGQVPRAAFVAAPDLGPGWAATAPLAPPCAPTYARTAVSSAGLRSSRGTLTETLATGAQVVAGVRAWRRSLVACGYDVKEDRLGDAGLRATSPDGQDALVVSGADGVLVVVHAHGDLAGQTQDLDGWADLAIGTSCVATTDGCS